VGRIMFALCCAKRLVAGLLSVLHRQRLRHVQIVLALAMLGGCSIHPIPDDVSPIPTEEIIRSARCEMRLGIFEQIEKRLRDRGITTWQAQDLQTKENWARFADWLKKYVAQNPKHAILVKELEKYGQVAVAYDFDFNIVEHNNLDASVAFKLPFVPPTNVFDLGTSASLRKTRAGQRTFKAQETFAQLVTKDLWCVGFKPRDKNYLYPITGSIGLRKVVETFVEISEQGGAKDSFVDTLTFTTTISGSVNPSVKLDPRPDAFRVVSASATAAADRTDIHKVVISLAFPQDKPDTGATKMKRERQFEETGIAAPYDLNPVWRARYNICVADARNREDTFKTLRLSPPEVYCIAYADAFVPRSADPLLQPRLLPSLPRLLPRT
jgi:hypothetical protein